MDFAAQIKELRKVNQLTQEQFAERLNVSRQAVSNWENNRNLPDIAMLILMSEEFHITLNQLILGGDNMTKKIINDSSESRRATMNLISSIIGGVLLLIGLMCLIIKGLSVEYVDASGILHENFFLLPIGFLFLFCGTIIIVGTGIRFLVLKRTLNY